MWRTGRKRCGWMGGLAVFLGALGLASAVSERMMVAHDSVGHLFGVDVNTAQATLLGRTSVAFNDIAFDPNGRLFGIQGEGPCSLYRIDPNSAEIEWVGDCNEGGFLTGLVFDPNGTLWAGGYTYLVTIDPNTGVAREWSATSPFEVAGDMAFDPNGTLLFTARTGVLVAVDPNAHALHVVGDLPDTDFYGLARSPEGILYALNAAGNLFTVDPNSGHRTYVAPLRCDFDLRIPLGAAFPSEARSDPNAPGVLEPNPVRQQ